MARIMIVDDSNAMRLVLRTILEGGWARSGCRGFGREGGHCGVQPMQTGSGNDGYYHAGLSGIEAIERLIRIDPAALILVVSSLGKKQVILEALQNGAKNFILKPFRDNQILTVVDMVLREYGPVKAPRQEYQSMAQA